MAKKIAYNDIFAYKMHPSGGYEVVAMVDGYRVARHYYGYTKRQAIQTFYAEINGKK